MKNMLKLVLCLLILYSTPCLAEITVGFIGPFSGPGKVFGDAARNGFELARKDLGNPELRVLFEDDQADPKKTVAAYKKLLTYDDVDVVLVVGSTQTAAVAPIADRDGVPVIGWASAEKVSRGHRWIIRSWASASAEGAALVSKARELGLTKIATLAYSDDYSLGVIRGFTEAFNSEVLSLGEVSPNESDFSGLVLQAKLKQISGIVLCLNLGQNARFVIQARQMGFNPVILGCEVLNGSSEIKAAHGSLTGAWFATVPVSAEFRSRYQARFQADTSISGAAIHYEIYSLLAEIQAAFKGSKPSHAQILQSLLSVRNRNSWCGRFDVVSQDNDQWFRLPIHVESIAAPSEVAIQR
jgi:branched-chain amino acid transport system substrate-binding protein